MNLSENLKFELGEDSAWKFLGQTGTDSSGTERVSKMEKKLVEVEKRIKEVQKKYDELKNEHNSVEDELDKIVEENDKIEAYCEVLKFLNMKEDAAIEEYRYKL